ncbi:14200_t:CDS:2, partial [Acaulospora morrowiae]
MQSTDLQDLLMCEPYFEDFTTTNALGNNDSSNVQLPSATLSEFEAQIQAMLAANNNEMTASRANDFSFDSFLYPVSSPENSLFASLSSPDTFINSPNSYTTLDDNCSSTTVSPPTFNSIQDFTVSPNDVAVTDLSHYPSLVEESFDRLLPTKSDYDTLFSQAENVKRRVSVDRDTVSPDESMKKKRKSTGGVTKSVKKTNAGIKNFVKNEVDSNNTVYNKSAPVMCADSSNLSSGTHSIVVPSSPVDNLDTPSGYATNAILTFNQAPWPGSSNQTIVSSDGIIDGSQFQNISLLPVSCDGTNATTKVPITRLKNANVSTQPQQNFPIQLNKQQKKVAHNAIERRYRNNINDRINDLKNVVPALCHLKSKDSKDDDEDEEVDGIPAATKLNKATILRKATEYIIYLKKNNQKMKSDNEMLRNLLQALPGGIELLNEMSEGTPPDTPEVTSPNEFDYPLTPPHNTNPGSRALMALFMCMTFFSSPSSIGGHASHHHSDTSRVVTSEASQYVPEVEIPKSSYNSNHVITIDIWYLARIFTFLICLTYILRPSLFSSQSRHIHKSKNVIISVLISKNKEVKKLYQSLSNLSYSSSMKILELAAGVLTESFKLLWRRFFGWDISGVYTHVDIEERLLEIGLWGRLGETELCGGNDRVSRLSILYTCLRTINLLESLYTSRKHIYISPSRIYANAALQCYIGLRSVPFISQRLVSHFWKLAIKEKGRGSEEKWLEIALANNQNYDIWKGVANRINDHALHLSKNKEIIESMSNTTIPLTYMSDAQALIHLKETFSDLVSVKYGKKKYQKKSRYTFVDLLSVTTPSSLAHWYALIGCAVHAFSEGKNAVGEKLVNKLKEEYPKIDNNINKRIIAMGLFSYVLLMYGKVEASIRCADNVSNAISLRKKEEKSEIAENEDDDLEIGKVLKEVHDLAELCVGWIVLEARILAWKIIEGLPSEARDKPLPDVLDVETRLMPSIDKCMLYLRRLSKADAFSNIQKAREGFIKRLDALGRIVGGVDESPDSGCEFEGVSLESDDTKNRA